MLNRSIKLLFSKHALQYFEIIINYKNSFYIFHSQWRSTRLSPCPQVGFHSRFLLNQGNDIITLCKCEIELTLHNKTQNEHIPRIYNFHVHKITKIPPIHKLSQYSIIINCQITNYLKFLDLPKCPKQNYKIPKLPSNREITKMPLLINGDRKVN